MRVKKRLPGIADTGITTGQRHSNSGSPGEDSALVQHLFKGSWKDDHMFEKSIKPQIET